MQQNVVKMTFALQIAGYILICPPNQSSGVHANFVEEKGLKMAWLCACVHACHMREGAPGTALNEKKVPVRQFSHCSALIHAPELAWFNHPFAIA